MATGVDAVNVFLLVVVVGLLFFKLRFLWLLLVLVLAGLVNALLTDFELSDNEELLSSLLVLLLLLGDDDDDGCNSACFFLNLNEDERNLGDVVREDGGDLVVVVVIVVELFVVVVELLWNGDDVDVASLVLVLFAFISDVCEEDSMQI